MPKIISMEQMGGEKKMHQGHVKYAQPRGNEKNQVKSIKIK